MPIIDPNNRTRHPQGFHAKFSAMPLKYDMDLDEIEKIVPGYWKVLFDNWTEPWPIIPPKPTYMYGIAHLRSFVQSGMMDEWPDKWWAMLEDAFMYPEYKKQ